MVTSLSRRKQGKGLDAALAVADRAPLPLSLEGHFLSLIAAPATRVTLLMSALFAVNGVVMMFLPRWLEVERSLSGAEIGLVLSLAQFARILTGPVIAFWSDGAGDRRMPMRLVSAAGLVAFAAFFFVARDFWSLLATAFIALTLFQAMIPLTEAALLRATAAGKITYGFARGIGSIAFIAANVLGGLAVARFGEGAVVVWILSAMGSMLAAALFALKPDPPQTRARGRDRLAAIAALLRTRAFLLLVVSCGLIQSAHAFYYGFSTIVWRSMGMSADMIGLLWAFSVAVEVAFLWSLAPIERRVSPEMLILIGAGASVLRWGAMGFAPDGALLWGLQGLHGLSFAATHVGAMRLIYRIAPDAAAASAQTLYSSFSSGVLMGAALLLSGWLYDVSGVRSYWAMVAIALIGGVIGMFLFRRAPVRSR